jgi:hypothetical protein
VQANQVAINPIEPGAKNSKAALFIDQGENYGNVVVPRLGCEATQLCRTGS